MLFWLFTCVFVISGLTLLFDVNRSFMVEVPDHGGELIEGIIGSPRFVNPLLSMGDADKDLVSLIYSGLMRVDSKGNLVPDLAESYSISPDGLTYDFIIHKEAQFHDGKPVTADDVVFTVEKAQDASLKSPKRGSWDGIVIQKVSDREVKIVLKQPYGPFLENTTIGILPKHIWKDATSDQFSFSEYNINAIGSGPYRVSNISRSSTGIPTAYTLKSFSGFISGEPYIKTLTVKFYPDEAALLNAYKKGDIESADSFSASTVHDLSSTTIQLEQAALPRTFAVFFNQNQSPVLANKEVRQALSASIDKESILSNVLFGYGSVIDGPLPEVSATSSPVVSEADRIANASAILINAGWTRSSTTTGIWIKKDKKGTQTLSFSVATGNAPELKAAAQIIVNNWKVLGADVTLEVYETGDLNQNIIRPRRYDALFFGEVIGRDLDFYPFWHSSQRTDPGLNIALYVNTKVDKLLEDARATSDTSVRDDKYRQFADILKDDVPVAFTYSPDFLYIIPSKVKGVMLGKLTTPSERFANIRDWYIETNHIWNIFNH